MSAAAMSFEVKGWCPGALRPMESGDGLLVRIRPRAASLGYAQMRGIAAAAETHGNGHIDLTRRANLQIRGVSAETLGPLTARLDALGLLDPTAEAESVRNMLLSPLSGLDPSEILDMRPLALELADTLAASPAARGLPAKFSFVLDGGGRLPLSGERADIRLLACRADGRTMIAVGRNSTGWLGVVEPDSAASAVETIMAGKPQTLQPVQTLMVANADAACAPLGRLDLGCGRVAIGIGAPFGRIEAEQLRALADLTPEIRLSPWRILYIPVEKGSHAAHIAAKARELGFVTEAGDPLMRIQACPGRPACRAAYADTRADAGKVARWMAASGFQGTAHVSGCAKGCASSARADITLVGVPGGYRLLRNAAARDEGGAFLQSAAIPGGLDG
jgi:precorrin-3B synthase